MACVWTLREEMRGKTSSHNRTLVDITLHWDGNTRTSSTSSFSWRLNTSATEDAQEGFRFEVLKGLNFIFYSLLASLRIHDIFFLNISSIL